MGQQGTSPVPMRARVVTRVQERYRIWPKVTPVTADS